MRELLLRDGKINGKVIFALALPAVIFGIFNLTYFTPDFSDVASMKKLLGISVSNVLFPFIILGIWALLLTVINPAEKAASIIVPAFAFGVFRTLYHFILKGTAPTEQSEEQTLMDTFRYALPFISPLIFITCCELFYPRIKNKIVAYILASLIQDVFMQVLYIFVYDSDFNVGFIMRPVLTNFMQFYITVYFFKLFSIPYKALTEAERIEHAVRDRIKAAFEAGLSREQIADVVRPEFPELRDAQFTKVLVRTANPDDLLAAKTINNVFIVLLSLSCLPPLYILFTSGMRAFDSYHYWDSPTMAIALLLPPLICFRLYLIFGLIEYKPYAYKIMGVLAGLGIVIYVIWLLADGPNPWNIIALVLNGIALRIAVLLSNQLYPGYPLITPEEESTSQMPQG